MKKFLGVTLTGLAAGAYGYHYFTFPQIKPDIKPEGSPKQMSTMMLEMGSKILQRNDPLSGHHMYLVGFHPMKETPCHQMEAHHFCKQVNEDFAECLIFDSSTSNANLTGIEYIISEKLFTQLPQEERGYWHPHNFEILSGQLVAPGLPKIAEKMLLKQKMNSYGKTFHTWRARCWEDEKPFLDTLPLGPAILAWSFNHDGEVKPEMVKSRDQNLDVDTEKNKQDRRDLAKYAHPQEGSDLDMRKHKSHQNAK